MFKITKAVKNPNQKTLYPWNKLKKGEGFFVPFDHFDRKPRASQIGTTGNEWAKRKGLNYKFESFEHKVNDKIGIQVNRVN